MMEIIKFRLELLSSLIAELCGPLYIGEHLLKIKFICIIPKKGKKSTPPLGDENPASLPPQPASVTKSGSKPQLESAKTYFNAFAAFRPAAPLIPPPPWTPLPQR
jgi:hypothetical protein